MESSRRRRNTRNYIRREDLSDRFLTPLEELADLDDVFAEPIAIQMFTFGPEGLKACFASEQEDDIDAPVDPDEPVSKQDEPDATACFAPSDS